MFKKKDYKKLYQEQIRFNKIVLRDYSNVLEIVKHLKNYVEDHPAVQLLGRIRLFEDKLYPKSLSTFPTENKPVQNGDDKNDKRRHN